MSDLLQKTTKINVFSAKFSKNPRKTQGLFENPRKNPRPSEKNPRTQDCFRKPKILGENPSSGNAAGRLCFGIFYTGNSENSHAGEGSVVHHALCFQQRHHEKAAWRAVEQQRLCEAFDAPF